MNTEWHEIFMYLCPNPSKKNPNRIAVESSKLLTLLNIMQISLSVKLVFWEPYQYGKWLLS